MVSLLCLDDGGEADVSDMGSTGMDVEVLSAALVRGASGFSVEGGGSSLDEPRAGLSCDSGRADFSEPEPDLANNAGGLLDFLSLLPTFGALRSTLLLEPLVRSERKAEGLSRPRSSFRSMLLLFPLRNEWKGP